MPSTYHLYQRYGLISPTETGTGVYAMCKYFPSPVIQQGITNVVYAFDATADYSTFSPTGAVSYYDAQFGMVGVGSTRVILDGSSPTPNIKIPSSSYYDTGVVTYKTASVYVWSEFALQIRLDLNLQDSSNNSVGGTDSTTVTLTPYKWTRIETVSTANAQKVLATLNVLNFTSSTDTGKIFYIDCVQIENQRWSTSFMNQPTRVQTDITFTVPRLGPDYTVTGWAKMGRHTTTVAGGSAPFFTLYNGATDYATMRYVEGTTKVQAFKDDTDPNTDFSTTNFDLNPSDLVFFALVNDGLTMTMYVAKNGDSSLTTANQATDFSVFNTIYIGRDTASNYLNGPVENLLIHKKALSSSDILDIFNSANSYDYASTQDIIFSYATPSTTGTSKALAYTGTGYLRYKNVTASLDIIPATGMASNSLVGSSTHLVYGDDVNELELYGQIATSNNLTTATIYTVDQIIDVPGIGRTAFVTKQ